MSHEDNPIRYFVICLALMWVVIVVACVPTALIEVTRVAQVITETATSEPIAKEIDATATLTPTPAATPTITPSLTLPPTPPPTIVPTPIPTISPLQKTGELPFGRFQFPVMAISLDGLLLAVAARETENTLYVFDMDTQTMRWQQENQTGVLSGYSSLAFSPDGRYLAGWDNGFSMFVWDTENGEVLYRMQFDRNASIFARDISFSPNGELLVLTSYNSPAWIYSMTTGELVDKFPSPNILIYPSVNGEHFLQPGDRRYGEFTEAKFIPNHTNLLAITVWPFPSDGSKEAVGGLYFWDMESKSLRNVVPGEINNSIGKSMVVSPNGELLVIKIDEQLIGWNIQSYSERFTIKKVEDETMVSITDTGFFATASQAEGLKIWDFKGILVANLNHPISDAIFMPDGRLLIAYSGDDNPPIEMWEIKQ